jgi:hypothetical protein
MDLSNLSLRELENLLKLQIKILEFSVIEESGLLQQDSKKRLEQLRNDALDMILALQKEIKKRKS